MTQKESIRLFEERKVRAIWDDEQEEWYFSIVDVISILTDSPNPRKYWSVLKTRLKREGSELTTNCSQLKMQAADGKKYLTDVANTEQLFRLIQSVPSPKAEPFKLWIAQIAKEDRKSTRLNSSHGYISYAVFCLKKREQRIRAAGKEICKITK